MVVPVALHAMLDTAVFAMGRLVVIGPITVGGEFAVTLGGFYRCALDTNGQSGNLVVGNGRAVALHDSPLEILGQIWDSDVPVERREVTFGQLGDQCTGQRNVAADESPGMHCWRRKVGVSPHQIVIGSPARRSLRSRSAKEYVYVVRSTKSEALACNISIVFDRAVVSRREESRIIGW